MLTLNVGSSEQRTSLLCLCLLTLEISYPEEAWQENEVRKIVPPHPFLQLFVLNTTTFLRGKNTRYIHVVISVSKEDKICAKRVRAQNSPEQKDAGSQVKMHFHWVIRCVIRMLVLGRPELRTY